MKAVQRMEDVYCAAAWQSHEQYSGDIWAGIQAVLDLIDPVPADVYTITDRDRDRWERIGPTTWRVRNSDHVESIIDIVMQFGPITWDGKEEK